MFRLSTLVLLFLCLPVQAAEIRIAFGESLVPFADEQTGEGIEIDIIRAALKASGHTLKFIFVPLARVPLILRQGDVDGAATLTPDFGASAAYSDVYIKYHNVVIAPKGRFAGLTRVADLANEKVVAFQNAKLYLGNVFATMANSNPRYSEEASQLSQVRLLFGGQADAIVTERRIYAHQVRKLQGSQFKEKPFAVDTFDIFAESPYRVAFRDPKLRDAFNVGLAQIRKNGTLARIEKSYSD